MTKTAKLDAPTISLDGPAAVHRDESADKLAGPAAEPATPRSIDNDLVAELESALQAVLTRETRPGSAEPAQIQAAPPRDAVSPDEAPRAVAQEPRIEAAEAAPPPYLLRPAAAPERAEATAWQLERAADADDHRPTAGAPRRRGLPLRAALCVAGVVGLAGAGGVGLMFAAVPDDEPAPLLAKPVRTETIRAPAVAESELVAAGQEAESSTAAPARAAAADTPAGEVTLLRPVGEARNAVAAVQPAERSPLVQEQPQAGADAVASQIVKAPDRLVEAPPPEAAAGEPGGAAAQSRIETEPAAEPAQSAAGNLSSEPALSGQETVAAVETPLSEEDLVARTGIPAEETVSDPEAPGGAAEAAGEPTRAAPVTSAVNMRAGPDNDAAVLTVVPAGSEVGVISCDDWCEVVFAGERGWIYKSFVRGADS